MKIRRIPETDLARIAVRSQEEQRLHLRQLRDFRPPHTLNPFRAAVPDIMNVQHEMLGKAGRSRWEAIAEGIERSREGADGTARNLAVAKALFDFSEANEIISYDKPTMRWNVGYGHSVVFWNQFYSVWDGAGAFVHFDPRLTHALTSEARRFAFSLMHQRLRVDDPDYAGLDLIIASFGRGEGSSRSVVLHRASEIELFSYDQLNDKIDVTYRLWIEELEQRQEQQRRAGGSSNPMGF